MFKTPAHRRFEFKSRYYDADAEARLERLQKLKAEAGAGGSEVLQNKIREGFRRHRSKTGPASHKQSNFRIFIIAGILAALTYLILK